MGWIIYTLEVEMLLCSESHMLKKVHPTCAVGHEWECWSASVKPHSYSEQNMNVLFENSSFALNSPTQATF